MTAVIRIPDSVYERASDVQDEYGYQTIGEAIRHMCRDGDHDV